MNSRVCVISAVRTAIGNLAGSLSSLSASELGAVVIREAVSRAGLSADQVDEVIMGMVLEAGAGQHPARQASLKAGLPVETPVFSVNKVCGSSLKAVALAAQAIRAGDARVVVAGGMESMSQAPYLLDPKARSGLRLGHGKIVDSMVHDGLWDATNDCHMGDLADRMATYHGIGRDMQDEYACESHRRAIAAQEAGLLREEIVPVSVRVKKEDVLIDQDERPRADASLEGMAKLKPAFSPSGTVTAANASGISDGAAALVLADEETAGKLGLQPMAYVVSYASAGLNPAEMGLGPASAIPMVLNKAGIDKGQVDLFEINEAFASQILAVLQKLQIDQQRVNVNGGAIAFGHPVGASGARIAVTLLHEMNRRGSQCGVASLCIGGGQGIAVVFAGRGY
ncbi:MAG: acetyl-CoA C-acetyltransferase [Armatimonadetes bacterium]|nr:acetyl-CoA C-acetyltransferase [Armatimonadota bacterium]